MTTVHVPQGDVTNYVDSNGQQIAEIDYDNRYLELGGLNNGGEGAVVILRDGHGRELMRLSANTGNLVIGGLNPEKNQDGDVIVNDNLGREIIRLSAGNGDVNVGGNGQDGRVTVSDSGGEITAGLDANHSGLLLRAPNGNVYKVTVSNSGALKTAAL